MFVYGILEMNQEQKFFFQKISEKYDKNTGKTMEG